jgi:cellulose synthase/poly-beta-1,6-N-acetylglucosamine synthase-like glycosyltransferase
MMALLDPQTVIFGLVLVNAMACLALTGLQGVSSANTAPDLYNLEAYDANPVDKVDCRPYFSVHVPTHNEPPEVVIATLEHISALEYDRFEVIVIDNNTIDSKLWKPVQAACARLGSKFRFYHRDNVIGAKAGALNIAAELTDKAATHFAIVDADYQVTKDFLTSAAHAIRRTGAAFVQFPQAYRNHARALSVATELADYFLVVASGTNRQQAMLLTGTLSVIDREAFEGVGGWSSETITEDAELGVRLYLGDYRGVYIQKTVGFGMLPLNFEGLATQRDRWAAGNVQTLLAAIRKGLMPFNKPALAIWSQLTAWVSLCAIPAFALIVLAFLPDDHKLAGPSAILAGLTITNSLLSSPIRWSQGDREHPMNLSTWLRVRRVKLALLWTSSFAWIPVLFGARMTFSRTPKSLEAGKGPFMPGLAVASWLFGGVALLHLHNGQFVAAFSCGVLAMSWFAAHCVENELIQASSVRVQGRTP